MSLAEPCPRCLDLARRGKLRIEPVQPIPEGVGVAPLGMDGNPCCYDCASADGLVKLKIVPDFEMARVAVANDRQEQYRLPGAPRGLVFHRLMRPSKEGDLDKHHAWLDAHDWFGIDEEDL